MPRKIVFKTLGEDPRLLNEQVLKGQITQDEAIERVKDVLVDYRAIMVEIVQLPLDTRAGMKAKELFESADLINVLKKAGDSVLLQDSEYTLLSNKVENFPWRIAHGNIRQFLEDIKGAEKVDLNA